MTQRQALFIFNIYKRMASLLDSFDKTNLDLENAGVLGGPNKDLQTQYPATSTGTPTTQANPGPTKNFVPKFTPTSTYLSAIGSSNFVSVGNNTETAITSPILQLASSLNKTNLDVENPGVSGGPNKDYSTQYPKNTSGTPTVTQNPGGPTKNFIQKYTPQEPYENQVNNGAVTNSDLSNNPSNPTILSITNLDVENPNVVGGPNKDISTIYPSDVTGTPTINRNPVGPPTNFAQKYTPTNTYNSQINNKIISNSALSNNAEQPTLLSITNLDVENPSVIGGPSKAINDPTVYPVLNSGTPTVTQNPSNSSKPFEQQYTPSKTYLENVNYRNRTVESSSLSNDPSNPQILNITNLDNSKPGVTPYKSSVNDPTEYPLLATGRTAIRAWTPTITGEPSVSAQKFDPKYDSSKKYQENIEVDLGIAPNVEEPEGPKRYSKFKDELVKKTNKILKPLTFSFLGSINSK